MTLRRTVLHVAGVVAVVAGVQQMLTGARGVRGTQTAHVPPTLDSELRFYAGWYAAAGVMMLRAARSPDLDRRVRPFIESGWAAAAASRLLSARAVGRPDNWVIALAGLEALLAAVLTAARPAASPHGRG